MSVTNSPYPFIERWGSMMGSFPYYITDQIAQARHDKAPPTAIYKTAGGKWRTIEEVTSDGTRHYFCSRGWMKPDWTVTDADREMMERHHG